MGKKSRVWYLCIVLILLLGIGGASQAWAAGNATFTVGSTSYYMDGVAQNMEVAPYINNGRTYVPILYLAQAVGVQTNNIVWDAENATITLSKGDQVIQMQVGNKNLLVNGATRQMDVAPEITSGRTFLPASFVAQGFGYSVDWDAASQTIKLYQGSLPNPPVNTINTKAETESRTWEDWPAAATDDPNHTWTIVFKQAMDTSTISSINIYVSPDLDGSRRIEGVGITAIDSTHAKVSPPSGGWSKDATFYLIITQKVLTTAGTPLEDAVRMPFSISSINNVNTETNMARGNIVNSGIAAEKDGWIYYTNSNDGFLLYKIRLDGSERCKLSNDISAYINVMGDWVYYSNESDNGKIYKINKDGSDRIKLCDDKALYINVLDDWIYYSNESDNGNIYKIQVDGKVRIKLNNDRARFINVAGDWIYYANNDDENKLYKIHLDGREQTKITDHPTFNLNVSGNCVYYTIYNTSNPMLLMNLSIPGFINKMSLDSNYESKLNIDEAWYVNVVDDWIYYSNVRDGDKLYKVRINGSERTKLNDDETRLINVAGDWIYYQNWGEMRFYRIRVDGSERQIVE
ncbi:MAG: DUF5050 domain-containing protein [Syntrophomonas sp.]